MDKALSVICSVSIIFLLCQCATKHQPRYFEPYFGDGPDWGYKKSQISEIKKLEAVPEPTLYEKKRLLDLYQLEVRAMDPSTELYVQYLSKIQELEKATDEIGEALNEVKDDFLKARLSEKKESPNEINPEYKKLVSELKKIWNQDKNAEAWDFSEKILADKDKFDLPREEWIKFLSMRFRIACDVGEVAKMEIAHEMLKGVDACHPDTAQAGFLLSLKYYIENMKPNALNLFDAQCDKDTTPANLLKRKYWAWRLSDGKREIQFTDLDRNLPLYSYYAYLTSEFKNEAFSLEINPAGEDPLKSSLPDVLETSSKVAKLWLQAENSLKANLKIDARFYLLRVSQLLSKDPIDNALALVYTAMLLRACGYHLEAMRILNDLSFLKSKGELEVFYPQMKDLARVLFPRPHAPQVERIARSWKVDSDHVYSLMRQESAFNPSVVSPAGARGLMQMMPELARALSAQWKNKSVFNDDLLFRASENLKLGIYHLHQLWNWGPHIVLVTSAYNAGYSRVKGWWQRFGLLPVDIFNEFIPAGETRLYVKLVLRNYLYYYAQRENGKIASRLIPLQLP